MKQTKLTCRDCGKEFIEDPNKTQGYRNQCPECSLTQVEPERIGGNMIWDHKTAPYIELKPLSKAKAFAAKTKRFGAGVTTSLVEPKEDKAGKESGKSGSGAELGADYRSNLGEGRRVKS